MNRCNSASELSSSSRLALAETFDLLKQLINRTALPRKKQQHYLTWLDSDAVDHISSRDERVHIYREFPSSKPLAIYEHQLKLWYWFFGSQGLLHELQQGPTFASIVSSRQSQRSEDRQRWFRKFLHAAQAIDRLQDWWLLFPTIATGPLSEHVAQRCNIRSIKCEIISWTDLLERLILRVDQRPDYFPSDNQLECWITPSLEQHIDLSPQDSCAVPNAQGKDRNLYDLLSIRLPDRLHVIDLRTGGNMDQLIAERLQADTSQAASVRIYRLLNEDKRAQQLHLGYGAIDWLIAERPQKTPTMQSIDSAEPEVTQSQVTAAQVTAAQIIGPTIYSPTFLTSCLPRIDHDTPWPYLTHCTRAKLFEWSDSSLSADWDRWLLDGLPEEASPWETLVQIARSQRLLASPDMTREKTATISFSAVPLQDLLSRRTYRSHLRRWDWEPYGVCIRQTALQALGAREVIYGDETTWNNLSTQTRPWFQPRYSRNGKIDWQEEREWRILGDLRLRKIPWDAAFFFVPTTHEAWQLSRIASWPVAVIDP